MSDIESKSEYGITDDEGGKLSITDAGASRVPLAVGAISEPEDGKKAKKKKKGKDKKGKKSKSQKDGLLMGEDGEKLSPKEYSLAMRYDQLII